MKDLVSIITPCYNSSEFIEETIQSVLNQTYENWDWLITDDLSTDTTVEIISQYNDLRTTGTGKKWWSRKCQKQ